MSNQKNPININLSHLAKLSDLRIDPSSQGDLSDNIKKTIKYVNSIQSLKSKDLAITHISTGLENITRQDKVDPKKILSQKEALSNAKRVYDGYFVVDQLIDNE